MYRIYLSPPPSINLHRNGTRIRGGQINDSIWSQKQKKCPCRQASRLHCLSHDRNWQKCLLDDQMDELVSELVDRWIYERISALGEKRQQKPFLKKRK